jgi:hypothetical protein
LKLFSALPIVQGRRHGSHSPAGRRDDRAHLSERRVSQPADQPGLPRFQPLHHTVAIGYLLLSFATGLSVDLARFHNGGFALLGELETLVGLLVGGGQTGAVWDFRLGCDVDFL